MGQTISLRESMINGLRRESISSSENFRNIPFFTTYKGLRATPTGARPYQSIANAFSSGVLSSAGITISHPFPQLFKGKGVTLLCDQTAIFTVDESNFTLTAITTYDVNIPANTKAITGDGVWQFMDFHSSWFLFNGTTQVFHVNWPIDPADIAKVYAQNTITITTGDSIKGRAVMGGFDSANYWNAAWQANWSTWMSQGETWGFSLAAPDTNWVWWSQIGGGDLTSIFLPTQVVDDVASVSGGHDSTSPLAFDNFRRIESGFMPMDWQGTVLNIKSLRDRIMVYGSDGVSALTPSATPIPTFGLNEQLLRIGLADRGAVGGNLDRHIFIDNKGVLWSITNDLSLTRLGYEEYLSTIINEDITITHDPDRSEFHISGTSDSFLLTETGALVHAPQIVTSGYQIQGDFVGIKEEFGSPVTGVTLETDVIRPANGRPMILTDINFSATDTSTNILVTVKYRYRKGESFASSESFTVEEDGHLRPMVSGSEFRILITTNDFTLTSIDDIDLVFAEGIKRDLSRRMA